MRRYIFALVILLPILAACGVLAPEVTTSPPAPIVLPSSTPTPPPAPTPTIYIWPTAPVIATPPAQKETNVPSGDQGLFSVKMHPDSALYIGDQVSLEVIAESDDDWQELQVQVEAPEGITIGPTDFGTHGIARRPQATLLWAWDTSGLSAGDYTLTFSVTPGGESWTETVSLLSEAEALYPEPGAGWEVKESDCCVINYITGTAAERDLTDLVAVLEVRAQSVSQQLGVEIDEPIAVTFLPRVLGHGGFASQEISVSYLDRNYAGGGAGNVLHHEIVHKLDSRKEGEFRPSLLVEGLAVFLTGGHFKPEPLLPRAAALLPPAEGCERVDPTNTIDISAGTTTACALDWYIPLGALADDFYFSQHEIGYLEAGALVAYMVDTWGWVDFENFYRDIKPHEPDPESADNEGGGSSMPIETALIDHFGLTLDELEEQFVEALQDEALTPASVYDVRLSVEFYDTVRRYQQLLDPSAYFLTAWLMDGEQMREREIVADYLRRPSSAENLSLETMLVAADEALRSGDFLQASHILYTINLVLDALSEGTPNPFAHALAADYYAIVKLLLADGYQPQKIQHDQASARVWATNNAPELIILSLARSELGWELLMEAQ